VRRLGVARWGAALCSLALVACGSSTPSSGGGTSAPVALKVAYAVPSAAFTPLYVGADQGLFAGHGATVTLSVVNGAAAVAALTSGDVQVLGVGGSEVIDADVGGGQVVLVAAGANYPVFTLYGAKGLGTPDDLAGKTVAADKPGTSIATAAEIMLDHDKLGGKTHILYTGDGVTSVVAALQNGLAQGAVVSPPATAVLRAAGYPALIDGVRLGVPMLQSGVAVTRSYLSGHRAAVEAFLRGYLASWRYIADGAHRQAVLDSIARYTKVTPAQAQVAYDAFRPIWTGTRVPTVLPAALANEARYDQNPTARTADTSAFIDNSVIKQLAG
jgi:NitT/TauT family transport system substrate-binding protein